MFMRKTPAFFGEANLSSNQPLSAERWSDRYYIPKLSKFGMVEMLVYECLCCVMIFLLGDGAMSSETLRKSVHVQLQSLFHEIQLLARTPSLSCRTITTHKCVDAKKVYIDRDRYITSHQVAVLATSCPISFRCRVSKDSIDAVQAACKPKSLVVFGPVRALDQFSIKSCYDRLWPS